MVADTLTPAQGRLQIAVGALLAAAAVAAALVGRLPVSVFVGALALAAYVDLRRSLAPWGHITTTVLGAAGVSAFLWAGYTGRLELVASLGAGLVLALLATRVVLFEARSRTSGTVADVAATLGAAGATGVLGAHILLIRAIPRTGLRSLLAFGAMVVACDVIAFFVGRWRGGRALSPRVSASKTWAGAVAGIASSTAVGLVVGLAWDPPFDLWSGVLLGAAMGVLAVTGDLAFSAIRRSAGPRAASGYLGPLGGALDVVDGLLFAAPAFYWALRTLAL